MYSFVPPTTPLNHGQLRKIPNLVMVLMLLCSLSLVMVTSRPIALPGLVSPSQLETTLDAPVAPQSQALEQQDISSLLYQVFPEGNAWVMSNAAQQMEAQFDGRALTVAAASEQAWGLQLASFGRGDALLPLVASPAVLSEGSELQYVWNDSLREWYINSPAGIEHGYTVATRPSGEGNLVVTLDVLGDLRPVLGTDGIAFVDANQATVLNYDKLFVFDANNVKQPAHFVVEGQQIQIVVDDRAAQYPLTIDPLVSRAITYATPAVSYERLGSSVDIYNGVMVVGAPEATINSQVRAGAVYVFTRNGTAWTLQQRIENPNPSQNDYFGRSVAIHGDVIAIGSPYEDSNASGVSTSIIDNSTGYDRGAVYLYKLDAGTWTLSHFIKPPSTTTPLTYRNFGEYIVLDNDRLFISEPAIDGTMNSAHVGAVHMFTADGSGGWAHDSTITPSDGVAKDRFGYGFAVAGDAIVVGAPYHNSSQGAAYLFEYESGAWVEKTKFTADDGEATDQFGNTLAIHNEYIFVSAINWDASTSYTNTGAVYVFKQTEGTWAQVQRINGPQSSNAQFGSGRDMFVADGSLLIGSARYTDMFYGVYGGWVWQATQYANSETWNLSSVQYPAIKPSGSSNTEFGMSMAYDPVSLTLVIGGPKTTAPTNMYEAGAIYTYDTVGRLQVSYNGKSFTSGTSALVENGTVFGSVLLNQTVTRTYTVTNDLAGPVYWKSPAVSSSNAAFSASLSSTDPLLQGDVVTLTVSFTPSAVQNYSSQVKLLGQDLTDFTINVSGAGAVNQIALSANGNAISAGSTTTASSNYTDFETIEVGSTKTLTYTIANSGKAPLDISDISLSGADAAQFSVNAAPSTVAGESNASFTISYTPSTAATHNAIVTIASNNITTPSYSFAITGQAIAPNISALYNSSEIGNGNNTPSSANGTDLGDIALGAHSFQTYTIANTGGVALNISDVTITGAHASDFSIVSEPSSIAVSNSDALQIRFEPSAIGARNATITIASDALNIPSYSFAITGKGTAAMIAVNNSANQSVSNGGNAISFGNVVIGNNNTGSFTIRNNGNTPLTVSLSVSGTSANYFTIVSAPNSIAAGQSATVQVRFAPNATGNHTANVLITNNSFNQASFSVGLSGSASVAPTPSPSPSPTPSPSPSPSPSPEQPGQKQYKVFVPIVNKGN